MTKKLYEVINTLIFLVAEILLIAFNEHPVALLMALVKIMYEVSNIDYRGEQY